MSEDNSVDIIILSWDRIEETIQAIESAMAQKGVVSTVIVVDQGSKPNALEQLKVFCDPHDNVILLCNESNMGVPGGRNQASKLGKSEFIVALDNDAEFIDEWQVAKACALANEHDDVGVLAFRIMRFNSDSDDLTSWSYHQDIEKWASRSFYTNRFVGAGHLIRRRLFEELSGYDDRLFFLHEEVDFAKRVVNAGFTIMYTPKVVIGHKVSSEHRVAWNAGRWQFDVRNRLYLHLKFKTPFSTMIFHTFLMCHKGIKSGMTKSTFVGLWKGLRMSLLAKKSWLHDPYLISNEKASKYQVQCDPYSDKSVWERIKLRIKTNQALPK